MYLCYMQSLDLLGDVYRDECYWRYEEAKQMVKANQLRIKYQKRSKYIPPYMAHFATYTMPSILHGLKRMMRQSIPNSVYNKLRKK